MTLVVNKDCSKSRELNALLTVVPNLRRKQIGLVQTTRIEGTLVEHHIVAALHLTPSKSLINKYHYITRF